MKTKHLIWVGVFALALAPRMLAQPAVPPPGGAAAIAGPGGAIAVAAPAAPKNIWSMVCMTPEQRQACRDKCCQSIFGQMLTSMAGPASMMSGGLITNKCLLPTAAELAKPADSSEGAAARIKADEADARARRAAVRYLGTVDCHYWPEAQDGLINALRADRNECVRFEAALALQRGCCCSPKVIEALTLTVSGSDRDGNPTEASPRVKAAAADALSHCTANYPTGEPELEAPKEVLPEPKKVQLSPNDYYKKVGQIPREQLVENARQVLAQMSPTSGRATPQSAEGGRSRGADGIFGLFAKAVVVKNGAHPAEAAESAGGAQEQPAATQGQPVSLTKEVPLEAPPASFLATGSVAPAAIPSTPSAVPTPAAVPVPVAVPVPAQVQAPAATTKAQAPVADSLSRPNRAAPDGLINIMIRRARQNAGNAARPAVQTSTAPANDQAPAPK